MFLGAFLPLFFLFFLAMLWGVGEKLGGGRGLVFSLFIFICGRLMGFVRWHLPAGREGGPLWSRGNRGPGGLGSSMIYYVALGFLSLLPGRGGCVKQVGHRHDSLIFTPERGNSPLGGG